MDERQNIEPVIYDMRPPKEKVYNITGANDDSGMRGIDRIGDPDSSGSGGSIDPNFTEETLWIVDEDNLPAERIFLTKDI